MIPLKKAFSKELEEDCSIKDQLILELTLLLLFAKATSQSRTPREQTLEFTKQILQATYKCP